MLNPIQRIQRHVGLLAGHVRTWHARDNAGYVRAGQAAIAEIDAAVRALTDARQQLSAEIRADELDRAARVAAMLAWWDAQREQRLSEVGQYVREEPDADGRPLPGGVEGYGISGRTDGGQS